MATLLVCMLAALAVQAAPPAKLFTRLNDVVPALRERLSNAARSERAFDDYVTSLHRETAARERAGEYEHLIYFLLQSRRFTSEARIEPALSAYELLRSADLGQAGRLAPPPAVARRIADFVRALQGTPRDVRLAYFEQFLRRNETAGVPRHEQLRSQYIRVMRFLYEKEFLAEALADPQQREAFLAALYQKRGHSTDTQVEANFAVHTALSVIKALGERRIDKVLVVGPGLDFAPRTDLVDDFPPQSYQPFAVADALLQLGLSEPSRIRIDCVDVNERVLAYLRGLDAAKPLQLRLASGIPERDERSFEPDYRDYFATLGRHIGALAELEPRLPGRLGKSVQVRPEIVRAISSDRLDVVTQRYAGAPGYDLVVVTNVLGYFDPAQQALALANIESMLKEGGYLVHNEPQSSLVTGALALGLPMIDARSVRVAAHPKAPLFDRVLIHRKNKEGV